MILNEIVTKVSRFVVNFDLFKLTASLIDPRNPLLVILNYVVNANEHITTSGGAMEDRGNFTSPKS